MDLAQARPPAAHLQMDNLIYPLNKHVSLQNNGTLYALTNSSTSYDNTDNTISGTVDVASTGGVLNTGGLRADITSANINTRMTISGAITGSSPAILTKTGPGIVTLTGSSSFSGTIAVNDGTLIVNNLSAGRSNISHEHNNRHKYTLARHGHDRRHGHRCLQRDHRSCSTPATGSVGTFTFGGLALTGGGQINYDLSNDPLVGSDLINVNGNLSLTGPPTLPYPT